jgi:hypothetical protein
MTNAHPTFSAVADVLIVRGTAAPLDALATVIIEVPHGADRAAHYFDLARTLEGPLPDQLEHFFFVNTDVGAWQLACEIARQLTEADASRVVELIRCLIPRTLIDTNRIPGGGGEGSLRQGGMTPGLPPYIEHPTDQARLAALHRTYIDGVKDRLDAVCGAGGVALIPHTYGPVTMGIERVDADIVTNLHWALAPERAESWPLRPEVDVIHATSDGESHGSVDALVALVRGYEALGIQVVENATYHMHPSTMGFVWSVRHPGHVLSWEVRRDLLVETWTPFAEMQVDPVAVARFAGPAVAAVLAFESQQRP